MSNNQSYLPSHKALIINKATNWASVASLIIVVILVLAGYTIHYSISRDCTNYYKRHTHVGGTWIDLQVGSTDLACPEYKSTDE